MAQPGRMFTNAKPLERFLLYESRTKYYLVGHSTCRTEWYVLQISRQEHGQVHCDSTCYTENQMKALLASLTAAMDPHGGIKLVMRAYGCVGVIRLIRNAYLVLVTHRKKAGNIAGHRVYGCRDVAYVPILSKEFLNHGDLSSAAGRHAGGHGLGLNTYYKSINADEKRYLRLFMGVDLCKDFYWSYTYPLWNTLQQNLTLEREGVGNSSAVGSVSGFSSMFVWNSHLAGHYFGDGLPSLERERWMVPLVHGYFGQVKLSSFGKQLKVTLLARRSRHFAGTRFLKRGVNELGQVANEVETEQIVEARLDRDPADPAAALRLSSVVQLRGSIPLYWHQETSTSLNPRPEIRIRRYDPSYSATRRHFDRLHERYAKPVIVLNLIKSFEKRPREMILRSEFAQAVDYLNRFYYRDKGLARGEARGGAGVGHGAGEGDEGGPAAPTGELLFVHWDFSKCTKQRGVNVLGAISPVVESALRSTGLFCCVPRRLSRQNCGGKRAPSSAEGEDEYDWMRQSGVLRTNCIDCLDRTNVAQFAYGLGALSRQMVALGVASDEAGQAEGLWLNPRSVAATELMDMYEEMGDVLAYQYGGSEAHSKFFKRQKGSWEVTTQSKDMVTSFRRFYSNTYTDAARQAAINLFLGHYRANECDVPIWELESDSYLPRLYYDDEASAEWKRGAEEAGWGDDQEGGGGHGAGEGGRLRNLKWMRWHEETMKASKSAAFSSIDGILEHTPMRVSGGICDFTSISAEEEDASGAGRRIQQMLDDIDRLESLESLGALDSEALARSLREPDEASKAAFESYVSTQTSLLESLTEGDGLDLEGKASVGVGDLFRATVSGEGYGANRAEFRAREEAWDKVFGSEGGVSGDEEAYCSWDRPVGENVVANLTM